MKTVFSLFISAVLIFSVLKNLDVVPDKNTFKRLTATYNKAKSSINNIVSNSGSTVEEQKTVNTRIMPVNRDLLWGIKYSYKTNIEAEKKFIETKTYLDNDFKFNLQITGFCVLVLSYIAFACVVRNIMLLSVLSYFPTVFLWIVAGISYMVYLPLLNSDGFGFFFLLFNVLSIITLFGEKNGEWDLETFLFWMMAIMAFNHVRNR
jgi:hypothetical protein